MESQEILKNPQAFVKKDKRGVVKEMGMNPGYMKKLIEEGKIPIELLEDMEKSFDKIKDLPPPQSEEDFNHESRLELMNKELQIIKYLQTHAKSLGFEELPYHESKQLFNNASLEDNFGIARGGGDLIYHLLTIVENITVSNLYETLYEAKGSTKNSKNQTINLTYSFHASNEEEAQKSIEEYKRLMLTKCLRVWMAYWLMANICARFEFSCPMIDVMKLMSDADRKSFFSVKEKQEHWAMTKTLSMTKLSVERTVTKRGTKEKITQWVEWPLLEIMGGEKEAEGPEKYPSLISVKVFAPIENKKAFFAALYKNNTLRLPPTDILFAFIIQTRASQMGRGSKAIHFDWEYAFRAGNLEATAKTKQAVAKAQTRKKMDKFKEAKIIRDWEEQLLGIKYNPFSPNKNKNDIT